MPHDFFLMTCDCCSGIIEVTPCNLDLVGDRWVWICPHCGAPVHFRHDPFAAPAKDTDEIP